MRTILSANGQIIDSRKLILHISYYSLSLKRVFELTNEFYRYVNRLFSNSVLDWKLQNRSFQDLNEALNNRIMKNGAFSLSMRGNVICEDVYNLSSFRLFEREKLHPRLPRLLKGANESVDYANYRRERSSLSWDVSREKEAALELLNLEGKYYLAESVAPDVSVFAQNTPMELGEPLFYGEFFLQVPVYCLKDEVDHIAEKLLQFCLEMEELFGKINAYVELSPREERYSQYFGYFVETGPASKLPYRNFARCFFFPEFGWGNVISPATSSLGLRPLNRGDSDQVSILKTYSGALCIRGRKSISETTITDLKIIKAAMYDFIMPRGMIMKGICDFRKEWEIIPVFDDELTVYRVGFVFRHYGEIDFQEFCLLISDKD